MVDGRMSKLLSLCYVIGLTVCVLVMYGCDNNANSSGDNDKDGKPQLVEVSCRLPIPVVDTAFSPYYLALDEGYYKREGLDVSIERGSAELNPVKMLASGQDQFAVLGGPELLLSARAMDVPLVAIALIHRDSDFVVLLTRKDSGLTTVDQLEGKRVGFFRAHVSYDLLQMLFREAGVNVQEQDVGFDYARFITGDLAAQWAFRTTAGLTLPAKGVEVNVISLAENGIHTNGHVVVTTEQMIQENPEIVQKFLNATLDGLRRSVEDVEVAVDAAIRRDPKFDREVGLKQMAIYKPTIIANSPLGWISIDDLQRAKEQMVAIELVPADLDVTAAAATQFLEEYYKSD